MSTLFEPVLDNLLLVAQCGVYFFDASGNLNYKRVPRKAADAQIECPELLEQTVDYLKQSCRTTLLSPATILGGCGLPDHSVVVVGPVQSLSQQQVNSINAMLNSIMWFAQRCIPNPPIVLDPSFGKSYIDELMEIRHLLPDWSEVVMEDTSHHSYMDELLPLDAISKGDVASYINYRNNTHALGKNGTLGDTLLRHHQNLALCHVVLCARAAISGGLSVEQAYTMADFLILAIERCTKTKEADLINDKAGVIFARMVRDLQFANPSSTHHTNNYKIIKILDLIKRSIYTKITREEFAAKMKLSVRSIDRLLKSEVNQTLMGCLKEARLKEAANLLSQSDAQIYEISEMLLFTNPAHFCRSFKAFYGMTPNAYRLQFYKKFGGGGEQEG